MVSTLEKIIHSGVNVIFAPLCPICKREAPLPRTICPMCESALLSGSVPPVSSTLNISKILSPLYYRETAKLCIRQIKYHKSGEVVSVFSEAIERFFQARKYITHNIDLIIPVPMHPVKRLQRGFNQAELIARVVSRIIKVPLDAKCLRKVKNTSPQTSLSIKERLHNPRGTLKCTQKDISGMRVLLVDDVLTTGATLDACALELFAAGAKKIVGFTLSRAL